MATHATDILVIGAGPAGSTCAEALARAGRDVILLDKAVLPRVKPCGGGLPQRSLQLFGGTLPGIEPVRITSVALDGSLFGRILHPVDGAGVINRSEFDHILAKRAAVAGAHLREGEGLRTITRQNGSFSITTTHGSLTAKQVCICDGARSDTARQLGFAPNRTGFCLECDVPVRRDIDRESCHRAVFHLGILRRGYAWAFPRGRYFAVGIGGAYDKAPWMRRRLDRFIRTTRELRGQPIRDLRGAFIPDFSEPRPAYAHEGAYLAGDAAGFVDALTGEGIYYALFSGQLAARAILEGGEADYEASLRAHILPELMLSARAARHFRKFPGPFFGMLMCLPAFRRNAGLFVQLLSGQIDYSELYRRIRGREPELVLPPTSLTASTPDRERVG